MTTILKGTGIVGGHGNGTALVTRTPINFTAALTKPENILKSRRDELRDRHHDLFGQKIREKVLVFPSSIGSTESGLVLLEIAYRRIAPAAMIVQQSDPLLVSGTILAGIWFGRGMPVVAYSEEDLFDKICTGAHVGVDGDSGNIEIHSD